MPSYVDEFETGSFSVNQRLPSGPAMIWFAEPELDGIGNSLIVASNARSSRPSTRSRVLQRRGLPLLTARCNSSGNRAFQDVTARNETGLLKRPATREILGIATRCGNTSAFVADALEFLNQVSADAPPPERLGYFHVNVAVGTIVME